MANRDVIHFKFKADISEKNRYYDVFVWVDELNYNLEDWIYMSVYWLDLYEKFNLDKNKNYYILGKGEIHNFDEDNEEYSEEFSVELVDCVEISDSNYE